MVGDTSTVFHSSLQIILYIYIYIYIYKILSADCGLFCHVVTFVFINVSYDRLKKSAIIRVTRS